MDKYIWLIPILPLAGFIINGIGRNALPKAFIGFLASFLVLVSFGLSIGAFLQVQHTGQFPAHLFNWFSVLEFKVSFDFLIDQLSSIMLLIITGVGFLIHLYSIGYMKDDAGFGKFFAYLNLFIFFMLLLVMGSNYLVMFIGWEGVGLCSYLLIGFWYSNPVYADAAKKAFIINRIGDLGFIIGIFILIVFFGSANFADIFPKAATPQYATTTPYVVITLLLFVGAVGKSAQLPLFTWLPDAMAGPTPVSALIHAATMVTAGIYMIARSNILFTLAPVTLHVIAIVGLTTAVVAALIALSQTDIKKVLAYSTVSQLGYMFLGLGVGAYTGAFFHVLTHAFFKALLFLGAGSVIHGMSGEQDMRKMGGLRSKLPVTFITMLIGTLAISGIPPFASFFSKDEILAHTFTYSKSMYAIGVITAMFTSFYMFRMLYLTFWGKFRGTHEQEHHLHESPASMTIPLIVLAILSIVGGFIGIPEALGGHHILGEFLSPVFKDSAAILKEVSSSQSTEITLMAISVGGALIALVYAYLRYVKNAHVPVADEEERPALASLSYHKFYIDELYDTIIRKPLDFLSDFFYRVIDKLGIDGIVNGIGKGTMESSKGLRLLQTGNVGYYIFMMVVGIISILFYIVFKK
jgi:NADH-quinone oxidoreductase subunit L